tara:strand:- start:257 stop:1324 length:1068 start_codon:yes stop_codon:yes gene_type:complete
MENKELNVLKKTDSELYKKSELLNNDYHKILSGAAIKYFSTLEDNRRYHNNLNNMNQISVLFREMNKNNIYSHFVYIPIPLFLNSSTIKVNSKEMNKFVKFEKYIKFKDLEKNEHIYLISLKPIKDTKKISICIKHNTNHLLGKLTKDEKEREIIFDYQNRKNNFSGKVNQMFIAIKSEIIHYYLKIKSSITIGFSDLFDEMKNPDITKTIKANNQNEMIMKEWEINQYLLKREESKKNKKKKKARRKERKKIKNRSAEKIQKWFVKIVEEKKRRRNKSAKKIQKFWKFVIEMKNQFMINKKNKSAEKIQNWWNKIIDDKFERIQNIINLRKKKNLSIRLNPYATIFIPKKNEPS